MDCVNDFTRGLLVLGRFVGYIGPATDPIGILPRNGWLVFCV
jgi:hypothetical protein